MSEDRRNPYQMVVAITTILSLMTGSIAIITFIQSSEKRLTTMEIRLESLKDSIDQMRAQIQSYRQDSKMKP